MPNDNKYIAYLLLRHQYMKVNNLDTLDDNRLLLVHKNFFPEDWELKFSIDKKIELLSTALKSKRNLCDIVNDLKINNYPQNYKDK